MAINFNNQNQNGIGSLDLGQFGMQQPEENMQVAEAFDYGLLPQATKSFTPRSTMTTGARVDDFVKNNPNATRGDFMKALQDGSLGSSASQLFDKNVDSLFEGVNLDKPYYGNVTPTYQGTTDGTFRGSIDIDKGSLNQKSLESLPADFFKSIGDQSSLGLPTNDRYASLSSYFTPTTMNDANSFQTRSTPAIDRSNVMGEDIDAQYTNDSFQTQPSTRFRDHSDMKSFLQANPDIGQNIKDKIGSVFNQGKQGILNNPLVKGAGMAFNAATGNIPGMIMGGIGMLGNQFADKTLYGDTIDENGNVYSADQLNKMNAAGGGYTDPARSARRRVNRIRKMKERKDTDRRYSKNNLRILQEQEAAAQQSRLAATRSMARDNSKDNTGGYQAGYSGSFMGGSGTAADMGSFRDGGLASMFTRRR